MKQLLLRADDLGFSEAVNYGILRTVRHGLIRNAGVMVNMEASRQAAELFQGLSCCLGLHCNVSVGRPLCPPDQVPTLVGPDGEFRSSRDYRTAKEEFAATEDFVRELTAQYRRFVQLFGREPAYFEAHAVESRRLALALEQVAAENHLFYQPSFQDFDLNGVHVVNTRMHSMEPDYNARAAIRQELACCAQDGCYLYVCHPGYLDSYLLHHSSLTLARADEVEMLCDPATGQWLAEHGFVLARYDELGKKESRKEG